MPSVPTHLRERALGMLQGGMRTAAVARAINCNVRTVRRLRQRYRETGWTADSPRSGRPRITTPTQDRYIRTSHLRDRMATTTARVTPGMHNPSISAQTVRNRLIEAGLKACKAGPHQTSLATTSPMGTNPPSLVQTGLAKSVLH
uniref:Transposase Tc1-like domain-containing protein n=1 Tax=Oncorhynchus tshawytscha TaxID=74940 RepID=A0AAZ3SN77_ONCTS